MTAENDGDAALPLGSGTGSTRNERKIVRHDTNAPPKQETLFSFGDDAPLPVFTSREEEIEFASQPAEEIVAAEADVFGLARDMAKVDIGDSALVQLEAELALIPDSSKAAYVEAMRRCPDQVDDERKKTFLWREENDAKLAANRLAKYWEHRRALFGEQKCYLPFTLAGALRDDSVALQHCILRVLPDTDEKGRAVILWQWDRFVDMSLCSKESLLRACWYTLHAACLDPAVRKAGVVVLIRSFSSQSPSAFDGELFWMFAKLGKEILALESDFLPFVTRGVHWCKPNHLFHLVSPIVKYTIGKRLRGRLKVHYGSEEEVLRNLEEYGMSRNQLPVELGGDVVISHDQWLADRLAEECGTKGIPIASAASPCIAQSLSCDNIETDCLDWEPIRIETNHTPMLENQDENLFHSVQSNQEVVSRLDLLESASSVTRKLNRQKQIYDIQIKNAKHKSVAKGSAGLSTNETIIADDLHLIVGASKSSGPPGRKGDPRMNKAVTAKLENPYLSLEGALRAGGFDFPKRFGLPKNDRDVLDRENVSLMQRKNQLGRRLRAMTKSNS